MWVENKTSRIVQYGVIFDTTYVIQFTYNAPKYTHHLP